MSIAGDGIERERPYLAATLTLFRHSVLPVPPKDNWLHHRCCKFPPVVTLLLVSLIFAVHYGVAPADQRSWWYGRPSLGDVHWYAPLSAALVHVGDAHAINNAIVLALAGVGLEASEGPVRVAAVVWASAIIGFATHGAISAAYVVGASGIVYGVTWCQLSVLALNWSEMPFRYIRLGVALVLAAYETASYTTFLQTNMSYGAHWGGAGAGIVTGIVLVANVRLRHFEVALNWIGVGVYLAFVLLAAATTQAAAAGLASLLLPVLAASAAWQTYSCSHAHSPRHR